MKDNKTYWNLLKKFSQEKLSPEELEQLYDWINVKSSEAGLQQFLTNEWEQAEEMEFDSEGVLRNILSKREETEQSVSGNKTFIRKYVFVAIRYAAIFVIAFITGWLVKDINVKKIVAAVPAIRSENAAYNKLFVPYGSKSTIYLSDGSRVILNSGSKLTYPQNFSPENRKISLSGEAYLDVKPDSLHPFLIDVDDITVRVLGTKLNIKAYPDESFVETTLLTGKAEIMENEEQKGQGTSATNLCRLVPNHKAVFCKSEKKIETRKSTPSVRNKDVSVAKADTSYIVAWKEDKLVFKNEDFSSVIVKLERWYNMKFVVKYPELLDFRITGKFDNETIEQALKALKLTTPFNFTINKNVVTIYK